MQVLVTGAAGFIGSTLTERLLASGHDVLGVDALTSSYDPDSKRRNLVAALTHGEFTFVEADLTLMDLAGLVHDVDVVFHTGHVAGEPRFLGRRLRGLRAHERSRDPAAPRGLP